MTIETTCIHKWALEPDAVSNVYASCLRCGADRFFASTRAEDNGHAFRQSIRASATVGKQRKEAAL